MSEEQKKKISAAKLGTTHSEAAKKKMSEAAKKRARHILQFSENGSFIKEWESARQVEETLGIFTTSIGKCCRGKQKTAGGYVWKYKEE